MAPEEKQRGTAALRFLQVNQECEMSASFSSAQCVLCTLLLIAGGQDPRCSKAHRNIELGTCEVGILDHLTC